MTATTTRQTFAETLLAEYEEQFPSQQLRDLAEMLAAAREQHRIADPDDLGPVFDMVVRVYADACCLDMEEIEAAVDFYVDIGRRLNS